MRALRRAGSLLLLALLAVPSSGCGDSSTASDIASNDARDSRAADGASADVTIDGARPGDSSVDVTPPGDSRVDAPVADRGVDSALADSSADAPANDSRAPDAGADSSVDAPADSRVDTAPPVDSSVDSVAPDSSVDTAPPADSSVDTAPPADSSVDTLPLGKHWRASVRVDIGATREDQPQIAIDAAGNALLVWIETSSIASDVKAARFDAASATWSTPVRLDIGASSETEPRIAMVGSGGDAVVAWIETSSIATSVYAVRYSAQSNSWSARQRLDRGATDEAQLRLAGSESGDAMAMWVEPGSITDELHAARFVGATQSWAQDVRIDSGTSGEDQPQLAMDAGGSALALWIDKRSIADELHAARFDAALASWSTPVRVDSGVRDETSPRLAVNSSGNAVAIWIELGSIADDVRAARYDATSASWLASTRIDISSQDESEPQVVIDSSGNALALWIEGSSISTTVRSSRYSASSQSWAQPVRVDVSSNDESSPRLGIDAAGDATVIWLELGFISTDIEAARYDAVSGTWSTP
ncbi:MAG: hypothetical protein KC503_23055, partial [Myxococcales bacterium]|nr:hypothetical protein [Myxococcales bacterium]